MKRSRLLLLLTLLTLCFSSAFAAQKEWTYEFVSKANGGEGFYNFGTSYDAKADTVTATINGVVWKACCPEMNKYALSGLGQSFGSSSNPAEHVSMFTTGFGGKISTVKVKARVTKDVNKGSLMVKVGDQLLLCGGKDSVDLTKTATEYTFTTATPAEGKLDIQLHQYSDSKSTLMIKSITVVYEEVAGALPDPVFSPVAGSYDSPQQVSISGPAGATIYYTTDGSSPTLSDGTRQEYLAPFTVSATATVKAVAVNGTDFSNVAEAKYVIRQDPGLYFMKDTLVVEYPDNNAGQLEVNPHNVSPVTYKSSDSNICEVSNYGELYTTGVGTCRIMAIFAGNDEWKADTASYTLVVNRKEPLKKPVVTPLGGTFKGQVKVSISTDDPRAKAIWYSTTAADSTALTDDPTIIKRTTGEITLTESCHLLILSAGYNVFSPLVEADYTIIPEDLGAAFTADEAKQAYYKQGFDSVDEASTWTFKGINADKTWTLYTSSLFSGQEPFSSIDPDSKASLGLEYDNSPQQETATSPVISIKPKSTVEFYAQFSGVWLVYADWTFSVVAGNDTTQLLSAFDWAQTNNFTGPAWQKFSFDLSDYAGKDCRFMFQYKGKGGDNVALDGFRVVQTDDSDNATITINEGDSVHFADISAGKPTAWQWTFNGGTPATSTEQNPVVTYDKAGTYDVTLTVSRDGGTSTKIHKGYIIVKAITPTALIGLPEEGYLSPWVASFVPTGVPVTYRDQSSGKPNAWSWAFDGADPATSTEQNPTVTYKKQGVYGLTLDVSNSVGQSHDFMVKAIQAGGKQDIWNLGIDESGSIGAVSMGYYGYYAGTNWMGITKFAEAFKAPAAEAEVDSIAVYFASTTTVTPDTLITVELCEAGSDDMPGNVLASTSLKASELVFDADSIVPTWFVFDEPVVVNKKFFVVLGGFPNNSTDAGTDDIAVLCAYRGTGGRTTTFHELEDWDDNNQPTGTYSWYENTDSPLSMVLTAKLRYRNDEPDGIASLRTDGPDALSPRDIYDITGRKTGTLRRGINIIRMNDGSTRKVIVK